jgi:1-acyl-sn-glycerol-3-phosphate acyltransferase
LKITLYSFATFKAVNPNELLYFLVKIPVRLALRIFCRQIETHSPSGFDQTGPLLITANHPNSFLDAIIIGSRFSRPVHFLARGDAFRKPWHNRLLRLLNMIPVYRISEGKENLPLNTDAFHRCKEILSGNGIVLIFIEGISVNRHELQPFKKGAARIAIENRQLPGFRVLPLGISYSSLDRIGKQVRIHASETIELNSLLPFEEEAKNMRYFNEKLFVAIQALIDPSFFPSGKRIEKYLFFLPAVIGYVLHLPLYSLIRKIVYQKTKRTIFYDSVLFGCLFCIYPLYLFLICFLLVLLDIPILTIVIVLVLHPVTARAAARGFTN